MNTIKTMKKTLAPVLCAALAAVSLCSCETAQTEEIASKSETSSEASAVKATATADTPSKDVTPGILGFSSALFSETQKREQGKNNLVSPLSVYTALGMAASGAEGNTLEEMTDVLSGRIGSDSQTAEKLGISDINSAVNNYISSVNNADVLDIANSIFVMKRDDITIKPEFLSTLKTNYFAEVFNEPATAATIDKINSWCSDKTHKMIPTILKPNSINPDTVSVLINAVAFEGKWLAPYDPDYDVSERTFNNEDGTKSDVKFMRSDEYGCLHGDNAVGFTKSYEPDKNGRRYCFVAILPDEDTTTDEYISQMTPTTITDMVESRDGEDVTAYLPKFTFDCEYHLPEELQAMGINSAFEGSADFSGITDSSNISIGDVIHKTFIEVDENGTRAAAATAITMEDNAIAVESEPIVIVLDRPFVFSIYDMDENIPIFIGTVCDMSRQN